MRWRELIVAGEGPCHGLVVTHSECAMVLFACCVRTAFTVAHGAPEVGLERLLCAEQARC